MYAVKAQYGYEIQVLGKGEDGLCRIMRKDHTKAFAGTFDQCVDWLRARDVRLRDAVRTDGSAG